MKNIIHQYHDGCRSEIEPETGIWTLKLPSGERIRGIQDSVHTAQAAVNIAHNNYILKQWAKGTLARQQQFVCPLT